MTQFDTGLSKNYTKITGYPFRKNSVSNSTSQHTQNLYSVGWKNKLCRAHTEILWLGGRRNFLKQKSIKYRRKRSINLVNIKLQNLPETKDTTKISHTQGTEIRKWIQSKS